MSTSGEPAVNKATPFTVHATGSIGQEIHDADGNTIAWTTDGWVAQVIGMLLNENGELLLIQKGDKCGKQ